MGVYLNTFRTEHKTALFNGQPVKVYAYRYLCKAQDVDDWGNPWGKKSARLLRVQCDQAGKRFDTLKPVYATEVFEDRWEGLVYINLRGALHYDTEALTKEPVGFLRQLPGRGGWIISNERHDEDSPMHCGLTVRRAYVEHVALGVPYSLTVKSWTFSNGVVFTPDQFEGWLAVEQPKYVASCLAAQAQRLEQERLAHLARQSLDACSL